MGGRDIATSPLPGSVGASNIGTLRADHAVKSAKFIPLVLFAAAAALVAEVMLALGTHAEPGAPVTGVEAVCDLFFVPGMFLAMVFMCSLPVTHVLMYGGAFIELFALFFFGSWMVRRLRKGD